MMEWHQNSHPLTKNEDGTPKVFYHGTGKDFTEFKKGQRETSYGGGFYFGENPETANGYATVLRGSQANVMPA